MIAEMAPAGGKRAWIVAGLAWLAAGFALAAETTAVPQEPASARDDELEDLRERLRRVERQLEELRGREAAPAPDEPPPPLEVSPFFERDPLDTPASLRGVYDKPFLVHAWRRAYFGGYTEFDFHSFEDDPLEIPGGFRAHRTNLFAFSEVSDRIRFGAEIEFENEEPGEDLEVNIEMAFVDWVLFEELVLRGGAILAPLGRVNVNHDGPVREITDRPMVSRFVIPTTLTEVGVGAHGTYHVLEDLSFSYEAYAVNGFDLLDRDAAIAPVDPVGREAILRDGRPSRGGDTNGNVASTGRISLQALNAVDTGFSWHVGDYDERNDNVLSILAGDLTVVYGPFAVEGELAWAGFERDTFARTRGIPDRYWGYYVQGSVTHLPAILRDAIPHVFDGEGAAFTVVLRYDRVDLDGDHAEALEPGLNFRPFADTVFKFSYRFGFKGLGNRSVPGGEFDDDGFVFSLSSYF